MASPRDPLVPSRLVSDSAPIFTAPRAVVFDVDGTLVDTERDGHRVAFNRAFAEAGLSYEWDVETYGRLLEITGGQRRIASYLAEHGVPEEERERLSPVLHRRKTELFTEMIMAGEFEPRPGVQALLDELQSAGVLLGVATTGTATWVEPLLATLFPDTSFDVIVTRREAPVLKPEPDAYIVALELLGVSTAEAVAIEDSRNGLVAARRTGLPCVIVANGYTAEQPFDEADLVLDGFGVTGEPPAVMYDPHGLAPESPLGLETLGRLLGAIQASAADGASTATKS